MAFIHTDNGDLWVAGFETLSYIANFIINGGGDRDLARDHLIVALQKQIDLAQTIENFLFSSTVEPTSLRGNFEAFLNRFMLCTAKSQVGIISGILLFGSLGGLLHWRHRGRRWWGCFERGRRFFRKHLVQCGCFLS